MGGVSQMPLHHNLGANLSVQVQGGKTKISFCQGIKIWWPSLKTAGTSFVDRKWRFNSWKTSLNLGGSCSEQGTQTRHYVARKSLKTLYMCQHSQMWGGKDPERATRTHIHTFAVCLIPKKKCMSFFLSPIHMCCPFSGLLIFNSSAPAKLLAQALTPQSHIWWRAKYPTFVTFKGFVFCGKCWQKIILLLLSNNKKIVKKISNKIW